MAENPIKAVWDDLTKQDLQDIYEFNKETFSKEFAEKVKDEIFEAVSNIGFVQQWAYDTIIGKPYRRILVRHYKIVYLVKSEKLIYILRVFDGRKDPNSITIDE